MLLATCVRSPFPYLMLIVALPFAGRAAAQDTTAAGAKQTYNKVIGAVTAVSADGKKLTVKPDSGGVNDVLLDDGTSYMLVPPGEKDLRKATRIELKDIKPGDRVYARSRKVDGQDQTPAVSVFVMSQAEVAQHQEKNRTEWQKRGAAGKVTAVDAAAKTITVSVQAAGGPKPLVIQTDDKTAFRRYAPDSVKFSDAQASNFSAVAVGNNVRVLGDRNADGGSIHAEELVSGSFRNFAGTVISVDPANNEVKVNDLQTKKPVTVKVNADTNLRKLPQQMAMMLARVSLATPGTAAAAGTAGPAGSRQGPPRGEGGPDSHPGFNGPANPPAGAMGNANASPMNGNPMNGSVMNGEPGHMPAGTRSGGRMDLNQMLERAPQMTLAELKPGDALMISSSDSGDKARATAITVVGGVEPLLAAAPSTGGGQSGISGSMTLDIGLPQ